MKDISNIEELLNGYVDGELTLRERTKVRRMADNDPKVAQKLEALRKGKSLLNSLPVEPAPEQILPNVMTKMRVEQPIEQEPAIVDFESVRRNVRSQRLSALAASIVFIAVLSMVINAINQQRQIPPGPGGYVPSSNGMITNEGFNGSLQIKTIDFAAFDGFLNRTIKNNSVSDSFALLSRADGKLIYQLRCSKERLSEVMTDLNAYWNRLDSATLSVDTGAFGQQVAVNTITTEQIKQIVSQENMAKSIEVAGNFAVINDIAERMPGNEILSAMDTQTDDFVSVTMPYLTGGTNNTNKNLSAETEEDKNVQLTIILTR